MEVDQRRNDILIVDDLFSSQELATFLGAAESATFDRQDLGRGAYTARERAIVDSIEIADLLWLKLEPLLPQLGTWFSGAGTPRLDPPVDQWEFVGCNPRTRFYRYGLGGSFLRHEDEPWKPGRSTRSVLTVLVYLPVDDCVGGETVIDGEVVAVISGRVAVFQHGVLHEGRPVERGQKLVLRNDVVASTEADF